MMEQAQGCVDRPAVNANVNKAYDHVADLVMALKMAKTQGGRTDQDRAVAVALTDAQKLLAWIKIYCME